MSHPSADLDTAIAQAGLVPGRSPSPLHPPRPDSLFARRAARLRALAPGHALADWLSFVATVTEVQHAVIQDIPRADLPPDRQWLHDLPQVLSRLPADNLPAAAAQAASGLRTALESELSAAAERLRAGQPTADDLTAAPFLAAAEQIAWTRYAATLDAATATPSATAHHCPVCGRPPVTAVIQSGAAMDGQRYLQCGCCGCEWHHVRATCVACGDGRNVVYRMIEGDDDGVRAECCDSCHSTLKLFVLSKRPGAEPIADDLATLALDILVGEEGYRRIGGNPFLAMSA